MGLYLWLVFCVVLVLGLAYCFTRYVVGRGVFTGAFRNCGQMEVLAQLALGRDQRLAVVRVGERCFLLGITAAGISALAELTAEEAAAWHKEPSGPEQQTPSFREALHIVLRQKGRR